MRYSTRILRNAPKLDNPKGLIVVVGLCVFDQIVEILSRRFLAGVETKHSNFRSLCFTSFVILGWWFATRRSALTKWIGLREQKSTALALGFLLGIVSSTSAGEAVSEPPPPRKKEKRWREGNMIEFRGTAEDWKRELSAREALVVAVFWTTWSGNCKKLEATLLAMARQCPEAAFLMVECDENPEVARDLAVDVVPDVRFYVKGREAGSVAGYHVEKIQETFARFSKK
jgi:thiol-disulfide isomerase/thioredoxin